MFVVATFFVTSTAATRALAVATAELLIRPLFLVVTFSILFQVCYFVKVTGGVVSAPLSRSPVSSDCAFDLVKGRSVSSRYTFPRMGLGSAFPVTKSFIRSIPQYTVFVKGENTKYVKKFIFWKIGESSFKGRKKGGFLSASFLVLCTNYLFRYFCMNFLPRFICSGSRLFTG